MRSHNRFTNKIINSYLFIMPFTAALAITKTLPLPLLFLVAFMLLFLLTAKFSAIIFNKTDFLLLFIFLLGLIPWALGNINIGVKNYNHAIAISVSIFIYLIIVRSLLFAQNSFSWVNFGKVSRYSLIFLSFSIILEFILSSFYGIFISDILPFPYTDDELGRPHLLDNYMRPRAFTSEAGFTALFFEIFLPISWLLDNRKVRHILSWGLILSAYLLLASAASMFSLATSILFTFIVLRDKKKTLYFIFISILISILYFSIDTVGYFLDDTLFRKYEVLNMSVYDLEKRVRPYIYHTSFAVIAEYPFGIGWGSLSQSFSNNEPVVGNNIPALIGGGALSLYLEIALASGWIGLGIFIFIIIRKITLLYKLYFKHSDNIPILAVALSLTSISLHYMFVSLYHLPFFWFTLALADYTIKHYINTPSIKTHTN